MNLKRVMALLIAAAFAAPLAAQTGGKVQPKDSNPAAEPRTFGGGVDRSGAGATAGSFGSIDRNNDGYISRDEARDAAWSNRFTELDKDNDGRLSRGEFDAMGAGAAGATVNKDANSPSTTGGMGGSVGPAGTQSGSSTSGIGDKPGQKQQ